MLHDLFLNSLILISFTLIIGNVLKDVSDETVNLLCYKTLLGLIGGMLGILIIFYNIKIVNTDIIVDLRTLVLMIIDYIGGTVSLIVTGVILGLYRLYYNGINQPSLIALISIILYLLSFIIINRKVKNRFTKWCMKLTTVLLVSDLSYLYLLWDNNKLIETLIVFSVTLITVGVLEYFLLEYVKASNEALKIYKENATKDYLTNLNNTRTFDFLAKVAYNNAIEKNERLSCLMIDIDHFKKVNDTYGHSSGDLVLKEMASILTMNCRSFDIVARIGGEEFCILLPDCSVDRAIEIGERIRKAIKAHPFSILENRIISITASVGVSNFPDLVYDVEILKEEADKALYYAKQSGRDKVSTNDSYLH